MKNFRINDQIELTKFNETIRVGRIIAGPFKVDKVNHYRVKWNDNEYKDEEIIADLPSTKYKYR